MPSSLLRAIETYKTAHEHRCERGDHHDPAEQGDEGCSRGDEASSAGDLRGSPRETARGSPRVERGDEEGDRTGAPGDQGGGGSEPPSAHGPTRRLVGRGGGEKNRHRAAPRRVFEAVGELREDPLRHLQKIVNSPYYRLRVGDYRVIMDVQRGALRILVLKVGHRGSVYER